MDKDLLWVKQLETPCFIFEEDQFVQNLLAWRAALQSQFLDSIVAYSVKTNPLPYILRIVREHGGYAEVVSYDEFHLAKRVGFPVSHIVYNGSMKDRETFLEALRHDAYVNIENPREIQWLREYQGPQPKHLGVRLNIDFGEISPEDAQPGEEASRFGFSFANGAFEEAVRSIQACGFSVQGIHAHRKSMTRSLRGYQNICRHVTRVAKELELPLSYVDIGGGFYGNMPGKPSSREYAEAIQKSLCFDPLPTILVEPGSALIAAPMEYCTTVLDTKELNGRTICPCDGSRLDIDPFFHKSTYQYDAIIEESHPAPTEEAGDREQLLAGFTCLEQDGIMQMKAPILQAGDRILFYREGAYTMGLTPNFIRLQPRVYVRRGGRIALIRDAWGTEEWIRQCVF